MLGVCYGQPQKVNDLSCYEVLAKDRGSFSGLGKVSPHDLRRTAITRALDQGLSYRQVQMMSGHRDPKTVMRYDYHRENMELNAINFLQYEDEPKERKSG